MADRRMFSRAVVEADRFLDLPPWSQALYFHLALNADDDGFIDCTRSLFRLLGCNQDDIKPLVDSGHIMAFPNNVYVITDWRRQNTVKGDRYVPTAHQDVMNQLQFDEKSKVYSLKTDSVPVKVPDRFRNGSIAGSDSETKERDSIGSISNNKGNREKEREGNEVFFSDPGSSSGSKPPYESENDRYDSNGEYRPYLWEAIIPKMFWGKFETETDYYSYAEEHRDEIIKMIEEMEEQEKRDGKS